VVLSLGKIHPDWVSVEVFSEGTNEKMPEIIKLESRENTEGIGHRIYGGKVPASKPLAHFTIRVIPDFRGMIVPLEASQILWES